MAHLRYLCQSPTPHSPSQDEEKGDGDDGDDGYSGSDDYDNDVGDDGGEGDGLGDIDNNIMLVVVMMMMMEVMDADGVMAVMILILNSAVAMITHNGHTELWADS